MKQNTLYTANKYNQNLFAFGGDWESLAADSATKNPYAYNSHTLEGITDEYKNSKNWLGLSKVNNPFSKGNIGGTIKGMAGGLGTALGGVANKAITGGFNYGTGAGNAISSIANAINTGNPLIDGAVHLGGGIVGGLVNRAFGHQENDETTATVNANNDATRTAANIASQASTTSDFINASNMANTGFNISKNGFKNGWFNKAGDKAYNNLVAEQMAAENAFAHGMMAGAKRVDQLQDDNVFQNFAAFGGPLDFGTTGMGAIDYGLMTDYLNIKQKKAGSADKIGTIPMVGTFADGGFLKKESHYNGEVLDVSPEEAARLMQLGYDFDIVEE